MSFLSLFKSEPKKRTWTTPNGKTYGIYNSALSEPHILIAGATGSGKSVCINGMIHNIMYRFPFDRENGAQLILIDPKRVELIKYADLPHTIRYASEPETMLSAIQYAMEITENRYKRMQQQRIRKYTGSDIYLIIDEFADLMTTQRRAVMPLIQRLAQIGRAARVHIVLATQTPIAKILPTEIKCNFDARIGLRTRSRQDSWNIIGKWDNFDGLQTLPQYGECWYMSPSTYGVADVPMVEESELDRLIAWWMQQKSA